MIRILLARIIASFYLAQGLWDLGVFLSPIVDTNKSHSLNLFFLIVGIVELSAGINLFKLNEFGRRFVIFLLYLRIAYNSFFVVWAFFQKDFSFVINYFDKPFFESQSIYIWTATLIVWIVVALCSLVFLKQGKTKAIFVSNAEDDKDSSLIAETMSNDDGARS